MKVGLEMKYAIIFSTYFLIYVNYTMEIFYKTLFYDVLVSVQCTSAFWTLAAHLVFLSYVSCLQNPFEAPEITESDEQETNEEGAFIDVETFDDEDICVD